MRVSQRDRDILVLSRRPWLQALAVFLLALGAFSLAIMAFMIGEGFLGIMLIAMGLMLALGTCCVAVFEQVRLDRRNGVVEIRGRDLCSRWNDHYPLSRVTGASIMSEFGRVTRHKTFAPGLVLSDPGSAQIPLTIVFARRGPAERAANAITEWLQDADNASIRPG